MDSIGLLVAGDSGDSGDSGPSGVSGVSSGCSGCSGVSGDSGVEGVVGCGELEVMDTTGTPMAGPLVAGASVCAGLVQPPSQVVRVLVVVTEIVDTVKEVSMEVIPPLTTVEVTGQVVT